MECATFTKNDVNDDDGCFNSLIHFLSKSNLVHLIGRVTETVIDAARMLGCAADYLSSVALGL